ncbi:MAG: hypothetical protein QOH59_477 [Gemmatimonadales bacterium]|jgi:hypothetical protein|nr:hypothetical protein [Gemmatimonadales bacterium]
MPIRRRSSRLLLLLLAASPPAVSAQITNVPRPAPAPDGQDTVMSEPLGDRQIREGLWLSGGLGYGTVGCCGRSGGGTGGLTGGLEAGWTLSRRFLLGIGASGWTRSGLDETGRLRMTVSSVDLRVRWYPSEMAGGFFVTGGGGLGFIRLSDSQAVPRSNTHTGRAFRAGPGYDFRVARGVSLTPFGTWAAIRTEKDGDHMEADVWQAGIWLTLH